jgi:hypothetical protein
MTGLSIRVRLLRALPGRYKVDIHVKPGSHQSEHAGTPHPYYMSMHESSEVAIVSLSSYIDPSHIQYLVSLRVCIAVSG